MASSSTCLFAASSLSICFVAIGFAGCGGRVAVDPQEDTGVAEDTSPYPTFDARPTPYDGAPRPIDTGLPRKDSAPPPPLTCATDLPADFTCAVPPMPVAGKDCTEAMVQEFYTACFGTSGTDCSAWTKKYPECNKCVMRFVSPSGWLLTGYCMIDVAPTSSCGKATLCNTACFDEVCQDCDRTLGSGKSPSSSEFQDCVKDAQFAGSASKSKGVCYDIATKDTKALGCSTTDPTAGCVDPVQFFRGACRDGGSWSNMTSAVPK